MALKQRDSKSIIQYLSAHLTLVTELNIDYKVCEYEHQTVTLGQKRKTKLIIIRSERNLRAGLNAA